MWSHVPDLAAAIEQRAARAAAAAASAPPAAAAAPAPPPPAPAGAAARAPPPGKPALSKLVEYPGDAAEVRRLLESGECAAGGRDMFGLAAIHKFAAWDKVDLLDALLPHLTDAELSAAYKEGKTALHHAAEAGAVRAARRLLAETYVDEVAGLELARININAVDNSGRNARQINGAGWWAKLK